MPSYKTELRKAKRDLEQLRAEKNPFRIPDDPVKFCELVGFRPTAYQTKLLHDKHQFIAVRWCRQSGKSHCVAALILWTCLWYPESNIVVLSPILGGRSAS